MVKMGGKSKNHQSPSSKDSEPEPPRIKSNVKHNLQLLKLWKEFQNRGSGTAKPATSYRKKKAEKDELPDDSELYRDPTNTLYYGFTARIRACWKMQFRSCLLTVIMYAGTG